MPLPPMTRPQIRTSNLTRLARACCVISESPNMLYQFVFQANRPQKIFQDDLCQIARDLL